jgi:uncharacterized Ntn-hydrolase superfamily protein
MNHAPASAGDKSLATMASGTSESDALVAFGLSRPEWPKWQLSLIGRHDSTTAIGPDHLRYAGSVAEPDMVAVANLMKLEGVPNAIARSWRASIGLDPQTRIQQALEAGRDAGGDLRGMHSAALMIVDGEREGGISVAEVNYSPNDPIAALHDVALVPLPQRIAKEERFDCVLDAWGAMLQNDRAMTTTALSRITSEARLAFSGAVEYLELVWSIRTEAETDQQLTELEELHPEWIEYARRGGDFANEISSVTR